jgi:hypothetical protein
MHCVKLENGAIISFKWVGKLPGQDEPSQPTSTTKSSKPASPKEKKTKKKGVSDAGRQLLLPLFRLVK